MTSKKKKVIEPCGCSAEFHYDSTGRLLSGTHLISPVCKRPLCLSMEIACEHSFGILTYRELDLSRQKES